ncbi:mRNA export factor Gle1 [Plutella xylostella]|uniref:mRNA export factor Gle1 n=1 Tax=Plutella xylostella TaxID=51655 RepID=UPI0005D04693|nr:mRNA export factor Gle1 [Plutella xylostella]
MMSGTISSRMPRNNNKMKVDIRSISEELSNFDKLRITALTKAAEISSVVKDVTIGPNSPVKKEVVYKDPTLVNPPPKKTEVKENLNEDTLGVDLRYVIKMKQYERQMQEASDLLFKNLVENMIAKRAETMRTFWKKQSQECEKKTQELRARKLQMLKELQENDNLSVLEKAKLDEKNSQIINKQTIETMNQILEEQNKATARFAAITDSHTKVCYCYNEINDLLQSNPGAKKVCEKYMVSLNTVKGNINSILDMCKTGQITDKEVKQAEILAMNIENVKKKLIEDIDELKQLELMKKKEEEEQNRKKQLQLEEQKAKEAEALLEQEKQKAAALQTQKTTKPTFYSATNYSYYEELKQFLVHYETLYKDLLEDTNLKKFRFDCQKAVNTPVNAVSSVSGPHMRDKYDKLSKLLRGERVQVLDIFVQATQHPQGLFYVTALLAKKIVRQGDLLVSSNPEAAFPLASVTVALLAQFPEFGKLLEAYFHRECPYLVPMFLPQKQGQTDKEFYMSRGYTYNDEGVVEKQDKFLKRMSGIFRLKCAIWIAQTPRFVNAPNPHGLKDGWKWLASFINLRPEPDISATLIHDFFAVCGSEFLKCYGRQFTKIIKVISTDYLKILENIDEGGPKTRLEVFLQNVLKTGHIPPPSGLLPANTW